MTQQNSSALAMQALLAAGLPVAGVADLGGSYRVDYAGTPTAAQVATAAATLAGLDLATQLTTQQRSQAVAAVTDPGPGGKAIRAVLRTFLDFEVETRNKVNELVAVVNAKVPGANVAPLVNPTPAQALAALKAAVNSGSAD
jgi:hypothetical protein